MYGGYSEMASATAGVPFAPVDERHYLLAYAPLVKRIARQLASQTGSMLDRDDIMQIGLLGLLEALRRYGQPDDRFASYAAVRVRGAILDELRRQDWRPRTVRQNGHKLRDKVRELTRQLGREPGEAEVVEALQISHHEYIQYQQAANSEQMACFDEAIEWLGEQAATQRTPEAEWAVRQSLEKALLALNEREQRVVQLYYEFDLSLKEIAAVLGLTEARVCQINKAALQKMKSFLQATDSTT